MRSELRDAAAVRVHDEDVEIPVAVTLKGDLACPAVRRGLTELRCIGLRGEGLVGFATAGEKHSEREARRTACSESHIGSWHEPSKTRTGQAPSSLRRPRDWLPARHGRCPT